MSEENEPKPDEEPEDDRRLYKLIAEAFREAGIIREDLIAEAFREAGILPDEPEPEQKVIFREFL